MNVVFISDFYFKALQRVTSRIVPQSGWGNKFPINMNLPESPFPLESDKKRRKEAYTLFMENHVTTVQTATKDQVWWFKCVVEATQKVKKGKY